jgi:hypothetical protein
LRWKEVLANDNFLNAHIERQRSETTIQSSSGHDAKPVVDNSIARISLFASGMQRAALALSIVASLSLLGWVMLRCRYGFDFTDEGFYLNWISNPWSYRTSVSQFGFVYHPLYKLVGGDVVLLRQANVLIVFALAWAVGIALLRSVFIQWGSIGYSQRAAAVGVALVAGAGSLSFLDLWLPTPSYNSLTFQSLMLAAVGAMFARHELSKSSLTGWTLVGIGGGFALLAKPTSAAMLGCLVAIYLAAAGKFRLRGLSISTAVAVLFLVGAALVIDGSLVGFVRRNVDGMAQASRLAAGNSLMGIFRWDGITISGGQQFNFALLLIITFTTAVLGFLTNGLARFAAASIAAVISALVIATITGLLSPQISRAPFLPVQFAAVALGMAAAGLIFLFRTHLRLSRNSFALITLFLALPYAYAFGSGNNYGTTAARAALFWFMAAFVVCAEVAAANAAWRQLLPEAAMALVVTTGVLYYAMENPYRQTQPLRLQMDAVDIIPGQSRLSLPEDTAAYIRKLLQFSAANGFRAGDPVLDLTGSSPGSLYVMGARPLGVAWTLSGYPGSTDFLAAVLDGESCEAIVASWILVEPNTPERFSVEMLRQFGIDIAADYVNVGSISSTRSFSPQMFEHRLLKPARSAEVARLACENARRTRTNPPR